MKIHLKKTHKGLVPASANQRLKAKDLIKSQIASLEDKVSSRPKMLTGLQASRFVGMLIKTGNFNKFTQNMDYKAEELRWDI